MFLLVVKVEFYRQNNPNLRPIMALTKVLTLTQNNPVKALLFFILYKNIIRPAFLSIGSGLKLGSDASLEAFTFNYSLSK